MHRPSWTNITKKQAASRIACPASPAGMQADGRGCFGFFPFAGSCKMKAFSRYMARLSDVMAGLSALILGAMALLILTEIILWNTLEKTTLIADEYSAYGLAAITFLGAGYCLKERGHIRITLVLSLLPDLPARIISALATALTTIFMGYLWWYLFLLVRSSLHYHSTSGTLTNTVLWIPQGLMLLGATCFLLQLAATTCDTLQAIRTGKRVL